MRLKTWQNSIFTQKSVVNFWGASPQTSYQGLCPWTPLGARPPDSHSCHPTLNDLLPSMIDSKLSVNTVILLIFVSCVTVQVLHVVKTGCALSGTLCWFVLPYLTFCVTEFFMRLFSFLNGINRRSVSFGIVLGALILQNSSYNDES